jgi:histidinol-phosphate aminotransferase
MLDKNRQLNLDVPEYLQALVPYPPGKPLEELEREYGIKKAIKLASNENPLGPSPKAQAALGSAICSLHRYPDGSAYYLKARLAQALGIISGEIVLGNGSNEIIDLLVRVFVRPGLEVVSSQPSFLVYQKMVQSVGGRNVVVPLAGNRHDLRSIAGSVNQLTRLIFLDNPNNPTGSVIDRKEFEPFLAKLPDHVLVVLDEAYMEFTRTGETPRGLDYIGRDRRVVTLRTFSKAYGLAGLRVGYGLMDRDIAGYVQRVRQPFNVNTMAQVAALAALDDDEHLKRTLDVTWKGIDFLTEKLCELGCVVLPSQTNFVFVDVGRDAKGIYEAMLRLGVIVRAMNSYGFPQHIRITAGLQEENDMCIQALGRVLSS